jgi:uncharacterized protein YbjT (DUF2867 family)
MTYVVCGATGNIGGGIVRELIASQKSIRVIGRDAAKLAAIRGAEVAAGSLDDRVFLEKAFAGATAVFALIPPNFGAADFRAYQNRIGTALAQAIGAAGIQYVVSLSSIGAQHAQGCGPVNGLHDQEQRLNALPGVNVLHLRPAFFMENHLGSLGAIQGMGALPGALSPELEFAQIATRDIAAVATRRLLALDWSGKEVQELLGPRDVSMAETARILGGAIGRDTLKYVQVGYEDVRQAFLGMGVSPDLAGLYVEMLRGINAGHMVPTQARNARTTTPTPLEVFAREIFAPAFHASTSR